MSQEGWGKEEVRIGLMKNDGKEEVSWVLRCGGELVSEKEKVILWG